MLSFLRLAFSVARDMARLGVLWPWASADAKRRAAEAVELESYFLRMKSIGIGYEDARDWLEECWAAYRKVGLTRVDAMRDVFAAGTHPPRRPPASQDPSSGHSGG